MSENTRQGCWPLLVMLAVFWALVIEAFGWKPVALYFAWAAIILAVYGLYHDFIRWIHRRPRWP